jgi:hypothetical protein
VVVARSGVEFFEVSEERFGAVLGAVRSWALGDPAGLARWWEANPDREVVDRLVAGMVEEVSVGRDYASAEKLINAITDTDQWNLAVWVYTRVLAESLPEVTAVDQLARLDRVQPDRAAQMIAIENSRIDAGIVPEHLTR